MARAVDVIVHANSLGEPVSERYFGSNDRGHHFVELVDEYDLEAAKSPIAYLEDVVCRVISVFVETGADNQRKRTYVSKDLLCISSEPLVAFKDKVEANAVAEEIKTYARFLREA